MVGNPATMPLNCRAPEHVTGGAAGASAAAVVAGEVSFALDTDHLAGVRVRAASDQGSGQGSGEATSEGLCLDFRQRFD